MTAVAMTIAIVVGTCKNYSILNRNRKSNRTSNGIRGRGLERLVGVHSCQMDKYY